MTRRTRSAFRREGLTPAVATALAGWFHGSATRVLRGHDGSAVELLPLPPAAVLDYLFQRIGPDLLYFSSEYGVGVCASLVTHEVSVAEALSGVRKPHPPSVAADEPAALANALTTQRRQAAAQAAARATPSPEAEALPPDGVPWRVTDAAEIERARARQGMKDGYREQIEAYEQTIQRHLPKASLKHIEALDALAVRFPNFTDVIRSVRRNLHLQRRTGGAVYFRPQLLLGPPGVGKTAFAQALAGALGSGFVFLSLAETSGGFVINGNSTRWNGASPGLIARAIVSLPPGQLLMVLFDELDKVLTHSNFPPDQVLLGLLEASTACCFRDEYLDVPMDLSKVLFLFTANRLDGVRPELVSRLARTVVHAPSPGQMPAVVRSVDAEIRQAQPALVQLFDPISDDVVAALSTLTPRQVHQQLQEAYATACEVAPAERVVLALGVSDLPGPQPQPEAPRESLARRDWPLLILAPVSNARH